MIIRSNSSVVLCASCALLYLLITAMQFRPCEAQAKGLNVTSDVHQEGTITLNLYDGMLEELGWYVPSGTERIIGIESPQSVFNILPSQDHVIATRGAFLISDAETFYQIRGLGVEQRVDGFWYVTASLPGKLPEEIEFDLLPEVIIRDASDRLTTLSGHVCLSESSASALRVSRFQGTCFAKLTVHSTYVRHDESTRWSFDTLSPKKSSNRTAKIAISCTMDNECPPGRTCDILNGICREGPDLIVGELQSMARNGRDSSSGITSFSLGTTSCNVGDMPANWFSTGDGVAFEQLHPVIAQNMHRYNEEQRDGNGIVQRPSSLEQIGMSWLKHGFTADTNNDCNTPGSGIFCNLSAGPDFLGVNCSDSYSSQLNGFQRNLGPRYEVNPVTGLFTCWDPRDPATDLCTPAPGLCFPCSSIIDTPNIIMRRIQIQDDDLSTALNPNSHYIAEGHYVSADDAQTGHDDNNASYREFNLIEPFPLTFSFATSALLPTQREKSAIQAWQDFDPTVNIQSVDVVNDGRFLVAAKATNMGDGTWHYEYAVQNLNSDRSGQSFTVPLPVDATVLSSGFHDINSHSGSPFSNVDWASVETSGSLAWSTNPQTIDPFANALRWGMLFNFRFLSDTCPTTGDVTLGLFKPLAGDPDTVLVTTIVPGNCSSCESAITLNATNPGAGFVDVLQPSEPDGSQPSGITMVDLTYDDFPNCATPMPTDYQVSQLGGMGLVPTPDTTVTLPDGTIRVTLSAPIHAGARTTITHLLSSNNIELGFLPGDVNRTGMSNHLDVTALADSLDMLSLPLSDSDLDRNGQVSSSDLLRLIDLIQGSGAYQVWDGSSLP